ncbi:MAG TPA: hypothetical protein VFP60_09670 [Pseudolabrys sp.]|nr:hypothetical protein [Pseudolabrys sp.]
MIALASSAGEASFGTYFVRLFEVDADQFQLLAQSTRPHRDCEYLNVPHDLSDLMRQTTASGRENGIT